MDWENYRQALADFDQRIHHLRQGLGMVDIDRAVQRDQDIVPGLQAQPGGNLALPNFGQHAHQRIDHHIADKVDFLRGNAFLQQVGVAIPGGREKQVGKLVGEQAVDLFGHAAVTAAQSGLYMGYRDALFGTHQGASQGRVDIANHADPIGLPVLDNRLEGQHDPGGLFGV